VATWSCNWTVHPCKHSTVPLSSKLVAVAHPRRHSQTSADLAGGLAEQLAGVVHGCGSDAGSKDGRGGHGVAVTRRVTAGTRLRAVGSRLQLAVTSTQATPTVTDPRARVWAAVVASAWLYTVHNTTFELVTWYRLCVWREQYLTIMTATCLSVCLSVSVCVFRKR